MLSVRLPEPLEAQLAAYCSLQQMSKSAVVQTALEKHLKSAQKAAKQSAPPNPFAAFRGTGNRKYTTDQIMRMTRGPDWNKP